MAIEEVPFSSDTVSGFHCPSQVGKLHLSLNLSLHPRGALTATGAA